MDEDFKKAMRWAISDLTRKGTIPKEQEESALKVMDMMCDYEIGLDKIKQKV